MPTALDFAAPKLGSGERFRKLSTTLAARGARNPDALAAYIGRRKYGARKFGKLSHHSHASTGVSALLMADQGGEWGYTDAGLGASRALLAGGSASGGSSGSSERQCPNCGYRSDDADFKVKGGSADTTDPSAPEALRTPANQNTQGTAGFTTGHGLNVRGASSGNYGLSSQRAALEFAAKMTVTTADDLVISRGDDGSAVVRHRRGGDKIGEVYRQGNQWVSKLDSTGKVLAPHTHQRSALLELIGTHNQGIATLVRAGSSPGQVSEPLQPAPQQTQLMQQYGVPAIRALATPAASARSGTRTTTNGNTDDDGDDDDGLSPKGQAIYKKLIGRGFPKARARAFAMRAQNMSGRS